MAQHAAFEISQQEWEDQIAWTQMFAREQKELRTLARLVDECPDHAKALLRQKDYGTFQFVKKGQKQKSRPDR